MQKAGAMGRAFGNLSDVAMKSSVAPCSAVFSISGKAILHMEDKT